MKRKHIRAALEQLNHKDTNPLYPDTIPDPSRERHGTDPRTPSAHNKPDRSLRLYWKDAVTFSLLLLIGGIYQVRAQVHEHGAAEDISAGVIIFTDTHSQNRARSLNMLSSRIETNAVGIVASSRMTQTFRNDSEYTVDDAIYAFGLPDQAAVYRMRLRIGNRVIESKIHEKQQAQTMYDNARLAGRKASLLTQRQANLFTTRLGGITAGETVTIEIFWQQPLHYDNGVFELRLPLALKPRFASRHATQATAVTDTMQREITINLEAGFPLAMLKSLYHPVDIESTDTDDTKTIHFTDSQLADNNDFVLHWRPATGKTVQGALFYEVYRGVTHQLLMLMPPMFTNKNKRQYREVILIADTSGSMHGTALDQTKDALLFGLQQLQPGDRFNIITFNDQAHALFSTSQKVNAETLSLATEYIETLQAGGGTNMLPALRLALKSPEAPGLLRQVIFITDGAVHNEPALFGYIHEHLGDARLFTIGIGGAPNSYFMRKAAQHGRGTYTYVATLDEVDARLKQLFRTISMPVLTGLELNIDPLQAQINPDRIPDLYAGQPLVLTLKDNQLPKWLTLFGQADDQLWQKDIQARTHPSPGIARLWARHRLESLLDQRDLGLADDGRLKDEITRLALDYHLVSPYTALVAVDTSPKHDDELRAKHQAATPTTRIAFPQTALGWRWQMISGLLLLMCAGGINRYLTVYQRHPQQAGKCAPKT